jgi:hypothetical protein
MKWKLVWLVVSFGSLGWWGAYSWHRLWRTGRDQWEQLVYDRGVRRMGASACVFFPLMGLLMPILAPTDLGGSDRLLLCIATFSMALVMGFPVGLWSGYIWGVAMAGWLGINRNKRAAGDLPPESRSQKPILVF